MATPELHKVHVGILHALRRTESARFSTLMSPSGLKSDAFKFYLRKLIDLGYVIKNTDGSYQLTASGKEFANNLDEQRRTPQRQPKLSVLIIATKLINGERHILLQRRLRNPFYGFWSLIGGPVQWGDDFTATAARELKKQTGLTANFKVRSFYRKRDYQLGTSHLLEDKLFVVIEATHITGDIQNTWSGGFSQWMTPAQLREQAKYFDSTAEIISTYPDAPMFTSRKVRYDTADY